MVNKASTRYSHLDYKMKNENEILLVIQVVLSLCRFDFFIECLHKWIAKKLIQIGEKFIQLTHYSRNTMNTRQRSMFQNTARFQ